MAASGGIVYSARRAVESSLRKTMMIDVEFDTKSRNKSAGRFLAKWFEIERMKLVRI